MTAAASPIAVVADRAPARRGRLVELLLVGGLTPLLFPLSWLLRRWLGLDEAELVVGFTMFQAAHLINDPHFSVTYLLFYRDFRRRAFGSTFSSVQRLRYLAAGVLAPLLLAGWAIVGLSTRSAPTLGLLIQLMFFLVGWHYVKQGFGVMVVLSARRGIRFSAKERGVILFHCYAGWAYAWANPYDPGHLAEQKGVVYRTVAHATWLEPLALVVVSLSTLALIVVLAQKVRREGPLPLLTPLTALLCSVWAWLVFSSIDPLVIYVVPALHGLQYLYFVRLMKGNRAKERQGPPWFEAPVATRLLLLAFSAIALGWLLFRGLPPALDDLFALHGPHLGATPFFAAIYALVNLHHYFMDSVIWRRDNPETRYLAL